MLFAMRIRRLIAIGVAVILATLTVRASETPEALTHVSVRAAVGESVAEFEERLRSVGMSVELSMPELGRWQGWIETERLPQLQSLPAVLEVSQPRYGVFAAGTVSSEGDDALGASAARVAFGVDGSGVRVAVISNGVSGLEEAQQAGDAPAEVKAYAFGSGSLSGGDEGTAMIEIIHDLAPGAIVSFGAVATDLDHMAAVNWFAARVDVIVDDVSFFYPADQASEVSLNTTRALEHQDWPLRVYVTAAGNWAQRHWSGVFVAGIDGTTIGLPEPGPIHEFGGITLDGHGNAFSLDSNESVTVALHWDDAWQRSTNDYQLYLVDEQGEVVASSVDGQGLDSYLPQEVLQFQNGDRPARYSIVIQNWRGEAEPRWLDLFAIDHSAQDGTPLQLELSRAEGSLLAQSDARGAITVGAAAQDEFDVTQYSSRGPTWNGAQKPELAAIDGVTVSAATMFRPRFSGSSAAAPHVAAAAALMLEAQPALLAQDGGDPLLERRLARTYLLSTARDIGELGVDMASGHGLVNVLLAVRAADRRIITVQSVADSGAGSLREAIEQVNQGEADTILFSGRPETRVIQLESPLPPLTAPDVIIDGSGWALNAESSERGIELLGDGIELWGLMVTSAGEAGFWVEGDRVRLVSVVADENGARAPWGGAGIWLESAESAVLDGIQATRNWGDGIVVEAGSTVTVEQSWIGVEHGAGEADDPAPNLGYGIRIVPAAGDVRVGPPTRPEPALESDLIDPLAPLSVTTTEHEGIAHTLRGWVTVDGTPAPAGIVVRAYLDRAPVATVATDDWGRFTATVSGPGQQIRFAVGGIALDRRVAFTSAGETEIFLRARSPERRTAASVTGGNVISANALGGVLIGAGGSGIRDVWGNTSWDQRESISGGSVPPSFSWVTWRGDAVSIGGRAEGAVRVDVYGGDEGGARRYIGSAEVDEDRFVLERVVVGRFNQFSAFAFDRSGRVSSESAVLEGPAAPAIASVNPVEGGSLGGELVAICGQGLVEEASAVVSSRVEPDVWFGGARAAVASWTDSCVMVRAPSWPLKPSEAGAVDVSLRRADGRVAVAELGYRYTPGRLAQLSPGWNLTTWSGPEMRIEAALGALIERVRRVYAWDAWTREWRLYSRELVPELVTLRWLSPQMSLWIFLDGDEAAIWEQPTD